MFFSLSGTKNMPTKLSSLLSLDPEGFESLSMLALNMRWSWSHHEDELWGALDPEVWELTHNPWVILQTISHTKLKALLADQEFRRQVEDLLRTHQDYLEAPTWFSTSHADSSLSCVAYFSMEFMLSEALPIYSGGLGNVAGDQLKAASDLGLPVIGVGLLYQRGYFRQSIDAYGSQQELYPYNDPAFLPITPVRDETGEWVRVEYAFPGYKIWLRAWQVDVGRTKLYLLDSNDPANPPLHRGVTSELYGGGTELRLAQEMVLGIGGWRLLNILGLRPEVCHLNEGHAALAVLDRARSLMEETGLPFDVALAVTRPGNLFTTHTPVPAGFDRFSPALIEQYLGRYAESSLGISLNDFLALGREHSGDPHEEFNMAYLALRGSGAVNGVSRLHGEVSRRIFQRFFPRWPEAEVPVGYVTNGIHVPSWDSAGADALWTKVCSKARWQGVKAETEKREATSFAGHSSPEIGREREDSGPAYTPITPDWLAAGIRCASDLELWQLRSQGRQELVGYTRQHLARQLAASGASQAEIDAVAHIFNPDALTLGFARRFATYKRPNLLLHDPERLLRILSEPHRPVQLIIAGKAHPADQAGQAMIEQWIHFIRRPEARQHVIFLSDYDMLVTEHLVQGVDVWINNPRRPWEASGTSGMKVLVNGGLNLSELDGWWAEAYSSDVGWAIGDGQEHNEDPAWDAAEARTMYDLLEREIVPLFYTRDKNGIPTKWVALVRESMARLTPQFAADRTVREYTEKYYLPAAQAYRWRSENRGALGAEVLNWQRSLQLHWPSAYFGELNVETGGDHHVFQLQVYLNDLPSESVSVELYADGMNGGEAVRIVMSRDHQLAGTVNGYLYSARVPASRPATDYTPRLIPFHRHANVPLEAAQILWQR
jgi:starch phosphorylase